MADYQGIVENIGIVIDGVGVAVIIAGGLLVTGFFAQRLLAGEEREAAYRQYRRGLGRAILLGLEVLILADIIKTIVVDQTPQSVAVLGIIVVVRIVLSWSLQVEIEGTWPWARWRTGTAAAPDRTD